MKKIITTLLTTLLLTISFPIFADDSLIISKKATINGSTFGDIKIEDEDVYLDYRWLTLDCASVYNNKLATFASLLAIDIYDDSYVSIDNTYENADDEKLGLFQNDLGLDDYQYADISGYEIDSKDTTSLGLAHKIVEVDERKYNVFFVAIAGTSNGEQWCSNFDTGDVNEFAMHLDWENINNHKGFDVAANRSKRVINQYIREYSEDDAINTILITGHSRGGAIASILGAYYEDNNNINSYTYTFSPPMNTLVAKDVAKSYKTIFNLANSEDFVTTIPVSTWGFNRYGVDIDLSEIQHFDFTSLHDKYVGKRNSYDHPDVEAIANALAKVGDNRDDLYIWNSAYVKNSDVDKFEKAINECEAQDYILIDNEAEIKDGFTAYKFKKQFILNNLSLIISNRSKIKSLLSYIAGMNELMDDLGYEELFETMFAPILKNATKIGVPHYIICSYAMSKVVLGNPNTHQNFQIRYAKDPSYLYKGYTGDTYCIDCNSLICRGEYIDTLVQKDLKNCKVKLEYYEHEYTGTNIEPSIVIYDGENIIDNKYYTVTYTNNKDIGTANVKVIAKQDDIPYVGSLLDTFEIIEEVKEENINENIDKSNIGLIIGIIVVFAFIALICFLYFRKRQRFKS